MGLVVEDLSFRYGDVPALIGVSLSVAPGEVLAVVGPSGSGKSTLLRLLCGLLAPDSGRIAIGGRDVTRDAPERRPVAMVFQGFALFPHLSVADNIGFGLRVRRDPARAARVAEVAGRLRLTGLLDRLPSQLSGGARQRVALARALVRDPAVFCLDEPLSSLDAVLRVASRRELGSLLRGEGRCAVYVTHDQDEALTVGDRVAVLRDGRLEQVGTPREVYASPATPFVASFVGSPPMSLLSSSGTLVGVRAEDVVLDPAGSDAEVVLVDDHGHELLVTLDFGGDTLVARAPVGMPVQVGSRVGVTLTRTTEFR